MTLTALTRPTNLENLSDRELIERADGRSPVEAELARRFASARADVRLLDWKLDSVVRAVDGLPAAPKPR
jgi:hypothetical protein